MKKWLPFALIILFAAIASIDLLHLGFPVTHDGQDHIARIANFYQNLVEGIFIPRWAANLNWGYGHPILEFLYPLPSYMASLFHFLGFSLIDSVKLVFAFGVIASGLTMYLFANAMWGEEAGVVAGILYMYAPYRFIDLYVRGDIGEHAAFVFVPLVCWGLYRLFQTGKDRFVLYASVSFALLILAHNAISLMMFPLLLSFAFYLWWQRKWQKKLLLQFGMFFGLGFLLASFFWVPGLLEGQYTLRNIVTKGQYASRFVSFNQLLYGPWSYDGSGYFTVQLGILNWLFVVGSLFFIFRYIKQLKNIERKKDIVFLSGLSLFTFFAIFLMLPVSNFLWKPIMLLQNFQFPWRFLAISVFTTSIMGAFLLSKISKTKKIYFVGIILAVLLFLSKDYLHAKAYAVKPETFFTGIYESSTDTGESAPMWSIRFMEHGFTAPLVGISGNAQITDEKRKTTLHEYVVSSVGQSRLLENTLYFPGWRVLVDGKSVPVQFQDPQYRGLMTFYVSNGTHMVDVVYGESKLRVLGDALSVMGIICFALLWFTAVKKRSI